MYSKKMRHTIVNEGNQRYFRHLQKNASAVPSKKFI